MPPLPSATKSKGKGQNGRRSRSRNTTPTSVVSVGTASAPSLEVDVPKATVPTQSGYAEILDRLETRSTSLEPRQLQEIIDSLKQLSEAAEKKAESCENAIRVIHDQIKDFEMNHKERERQVEETRRAKKDVSTKLKKAKKRKDRSEDVDGIEIKREEDGGSRFDRASGTPGAADMPSPAKKAKLSPGTSSLSEVADSPAAGVAQTPAAKTEASDDEENTIVKRAPPILQTGYFPDPLAPDPVIYEIREVTPGTSEREKKEIYAVTYYPTKDLSDQVAGQPPDKDFSNAKPSNQVAANTFLTYAEPYLRPLIEEDMAFLRERGERSAPFEYVQRSRKHYTEKWAEEDGMTIDLTEKPSTNVPRGNADQIDDTNLDKDHISTGPLASRLLSLLKFEHRSPPVENGETKETNAFDNDTMDLDGLLNGDSSDKPLAPATSVSELTSSKSTLQKLDYVQSDERLKAELRYLGLLGPEDNPDYDAHHDDDISERLRLLQAELRRLMIINGARKSRLLDLAKERLAYQEYSTIHEDLDSQVQQAYLKRTRTLGKTKKGGPGANKPRQGHIATALGMGRRDIGDSARMLMDRRKRWQTCIGPVFKDMKTGIPDKEMTLWESAVMERYEKLELEALEDDGE